MCPVANTGSIALFSGALSAADVDLLVVPWFEGEAPTVLEKLDRATGGELLRSLVTREFGGRLFDLFVTQVIDGSWKAKRVALIGAGSAQAFGTTEARRVATAAGLAARQRRAERLGCVLRPGTPDASGDIDVAGFLQVVAEGLTLDRKSTRLNSSHIQKSRMPSSA